MSCHKQLGRTWFASLLLLLFGASAQAVDISEGSRVRLRPYYHSTYITGEFVKYAGDSVYVRVDGQNEPQAFASWRLASLEASTGQRLSVSRGALIGGAFGLIAGSLAGTLATESEPCPPEGCRMDHGDTTGPLILGASTAAGIVLGMVTARVLGEGWATVAPADLGYNGARGPRLTLAFGF